MTLPTRRRLRLLELHASRRSRQEGERGQILVLFTIALIVILASTALVVDLGVLRNDRQTLANALDAGALAGGTLMPVGKNGSTKAQVETVVRETIRANFPGIPDSAYSISYRCLIRAQDGVPMIDSQIPVEPDELTPKGATQVCDPTGTLTRRPVATDFSGAGTKRSSICDPSPAGQLPNSDKCNVIVVTGSVDTPFGFARVVGVNQGSTGAVTSAACNGPCGEPIGVPLDVVMVMDRTYSMTTPSDMIPQLRQAGLKVLEIYNPEYQHIALGLIGPSSLTRTGGSCPTGLHGLVVEEPGDPVSYEGQIREDPASSNVTSLTIDRPSSTADTDLLVASIAFRPTVSSGTLSNPANINITTPTGWTQINRRNQGTGTSAVALVTFRRFGGSGTNQTSGAAGYRFTFSTNVRASGGILRFAGADQADPIVTSTVNSGASGNAVASGLTSGNNTIVMATFTRQDSANIAAPSGMTERYNTTGGNGPSVSADTMDWSGGNTNNRTASGGSGNWAAQQIAIRSADLTPEYGTTYGANYTGDTPKWLPVELTGHSTLPGTPRIDQEYSYADGSLNTSSYLYQMINCFTPATPYPGTNLRTPIEMATAYLQEFGREGVQPVIILETDGQPQISTTGDTNNYTCAGTNTAANAAKAAGIQIFTIGFFRGGTIPGCPDSGLPSTMNDAAELLGSVSSAYTGSEVRTPDTLDDCSARENGDADNFYCASSGADLTTVFQRAAMAAVNSNVRLVSVYPPPDINSVGPNVGNAPMTVTITGKNFTGATDVDFGGTPASSFTVVSDTSITASVPAGTAGQTVHIRVSTPGGASPVEAADRFTYN